MSLAKLVLAEPFKPIQNIVLTKNPFVIGRNSDCDLILDRPSISKHHVRITFDGEQHLVDDLESKNGTMLNGETIQSGTLENDDVITIGGIDLIFQKILQEQVQADLEKNLNMFKSALRYTKSINANQILEPILDEIMNALMRLSQGERGFLLLADEDNRLQMKRSVNITSEELHEENSRLSLTAVEKAVQSRQTVAVSNALDDSYFGGQTSVQELALRTLVCIPIVGDQDKVLGILYADSSSNKQQFTQLDVDVLESLAANAGIAIENANLNCEIWNLIDRASDILKQVEQKTDLESGLQQSLRNTLDSLSVLDQKRGSRRKKDPT